MVDRISRTGELGSNAFTARERKETKCIERRHGGEKMSTDSALLADIEKRQIRPKLARPKLTTINLYCGRQKYPAEGSEVSDVQGPARPGSAGLGSAWAARASNSPGPSPSPDCGS